MNLWSVPIIIKPILLQIMPMTYQSSLTHRSPISEWALDNARRLSNSTSMALPSCLYSMGRCHYESVVSSSYPGANLAPINANGISIIIDTGASYFLSLIPADCTTFRKISPCLHGISVKQKLKEKGWLSFMQRTEHPMSIMLSKNSMFLLIKIWSHFVDVGTKHQVKRGRMSTSVKACCS